MSLESRLTALVQSLGADYKARKAQLDQLASAAYAWKSQIIVAPNYVGVTTVVEPFQGFKPEANTRYQVEVWASVRVATIVNAPQAALFGPSGGNSLRYSAVKIVSAPTTTTDLVSHVQLNEFQASNSALTIPDILTIQAIVETGAGMTDSAWIRPQFRPKSAGGSYDISPGSIMSWRTI